MGLKLRRITVPRKWAQSQITAEKPINYRGLSVPTGPMPMPVPIWRMLYKGRYELPELEACAALVKPGDRILELGTGIGVISGLVSRMAENLEIQSYEANPTLVKNINKLHEMNGITNVTVHNALLEPNPDVTARMFHIAKFFTDGSVIETDKSEDTVEVRVEDINAVMKDFAPAVFICDIEGAEEYVLPNTNMESVRALILELHPKIISRQGVKKIYDACASHGLYPSVEHSSEQVVAFERVG